MTARVAHSPRVQVVAKDMKQGGVTVRLLPPIPRHTQGYTAWCDDEACGTHSEGRLVSMWRGTIHLVGYESAPQREAELDAERHNEERHPALQDSETGEQ